MDIIVSLIVGLIRDLLVQGAGIALVQLIYRGRVVPDPCGTQIDETRIRRVKGPIYVADGRARMQWDAVFFFGLVFWLVVGLAVLIWAVIGNQ